MIASSLFYCITTIKWVNNLFNLKQSLSKLHNMVIYRSIINYKIVIRIFSLALYYNLFTTFCGLPSTYVLRFSAVMSMILWRAAFAAQEICGVMRQFFALRSGLSPLIGSVETTSSPAAYTLPLFSASARSCSTTS